MKMINDLYDYKNMKIVQETNYFKFSIDSVLLAEFVKIHNNNNKKIIDICTGNAPIPLILSQKCQNQIIGFEIQTEIYNLGIESIKLNNKENQIKLINDDIKKFLNYFPKNEFGIVISNPPYYTKNIINDNLIKSIARHEIKLSLEELFECVNIIIKNNGIFYLVHLANRLEEIMNLANKYKMHVKELCLVYGKKNSEANLVLVKMVKNSNMGMKILKSIVIEEYESYQNIFRKE